MVAQVETRPAALNPRICLEVEGLVQIVTAPHRSFFTNIMAQALRIAGQGTRVLVVQFLKGGIRMGPEHPIQLCQNLEWLRCNLPRCIDTPELDEAEMQALQDLWQYTQQAVRSQQYELVVLDELSLAIHLNLIAEAEVLALIEHRPRPIDMILTGPEMPSSLLEVADQVTQLRRSFCP
ncbi:P-loop NTPase family protein [Synechococcales cyanobacterium C]|uniref:P-loop NTPase family protein n=2 Tax=Petrachloros TaxID=2918834 RepID=A0A8K2A8U0_9CYAN|nr:P-loop NTPase family protein [Petrachloros mirabilis]NCJ07435.1 P-loop NTPase family protein [Petrachloros mirabilis ULC683]